MGSLRLIQIRAMFVNKIVRKLASVRRRCTTTTAPTSPPKKLGVFESFKQMELGERLFHYLVTGCSIAALSFGLEMGIHLLDSENDVSYPSSEFMGEDVKISAFRGLFWPICLAVYFLKPPKSINRRLREKKIGKNKVE
jgi:hypothetical protein